MRMIWVMDDQPVALPTRTERKERTRRAILDAALTLTEQSSLSALSLRHVAREVGIAPTAFYRHFASAEDLGLALVDESFSSLRRTLRDVRAAQPSVGGVIGPSVEVLVERVRADPEHFGFISRERVGGLPGVRAAIRHELDLFEAEIATDFARLPGAVHWSTDDLRTSANLIVIAMVAAAERLLQGPGTPAFEREVARSTATQLRMLSIGAIQWRSRPQDRGGSGRLRAADDTTTS
ncbi:AcrR family transcriptional regulator [Aeromicrobium sp. SORGH_AS981]|jgi:AcrR family transcriptional regulator|nr:AcrR family transcriptional regulator [Aeromicrobium sp. SORGH_AS_0981]